MTCKIDSLLKYEQPTKYIVSSEDYSEDFATPVLTAGKSFILGYTNENEGICYASSNPIIIFDDFTTDSKFVDFDFKVKSSAMKILRKRNPNDNLKYLYYTINRLRYKPFSHKRTWISEFSQLEIPYVSPDEQNRIVAELDKIQGAIGNKRQQLVKLDELVNTKFYEMFGDPIANPKGWETKKFSSCFKLSSGDALSAKQIIEGIYPVYGGNGITGYHNTYNLNGENIIIGRVGALCGNVRLINEPIFATDNAFILTNLSPLINAFIQHLLTHINLRQYAKEAAQPVISNISLKDIMVIIQPLEKQEQFANLAQKIEQAKDIVTKQINNLQELLDSRMDFYFRQ